MDIHQKIKLARIMSGFRQSDLADMLGIKQSVIARYEAEDGRVPRTDAVHQIAEATGWAEDWFENDTLQGIVVCSPTLPHIYYSETALTTIEKGLSSLLPELFSQQDFNGAVVLRMNQLMKSKDGSEIEQAYVIYNSNLCFVIFPNNLNHLFNKMIKAKFNEIEDDFVAGGILLHSLWTSPYGAEFLEFIKFIDIPEQFISAAEKRVPPTSKNTRLVIEISPPIGVHLDLIKEVEHALTRSGISIHSIKHLTPG